MNEPVTFILVGGPRCGTTALFTYLSEHPRIHITTPKEPLHFCDDFEPYRVVRERQKYDAMMRCPPGKLAVGEGSTMYLLSENALPAIREWREDVRILLALRDPIELFLSWHGWMIQSLEEDQENPETAWNLQADRREGRNLAKGTRVPELVQYRDVCGLGTHAKRLLQIFPREQIHVVVLEKMINKPRETYEDVLAFLDVPSDGRTDFPKVNERRSWRSAAVANLYFNPPWPLKGLMESLRQRWLRLPEKTRAKVRGLFFSRGGEKPPVSPQFRSQLVEEFRDEVHDLEEVLDIDLSCWGYGPSRQTAAT